MSDVRRRALERQALASGTVEDRAALLRARVRAGELTLDRIALAAFCGDEAALVVDGGPYTDHCYGCERSGVRYEGTDPNGALRCARCWDLASWVWGLRASLSSGYQEAEIRACMAAAEVVHADWDHGLIDDPEGRTVDMPPAACPGDGCPILAVTAAMRAYLDAPTAPGARCRWWVAAARGTVDGGNAGYWVPWPDHCAHDPGEPVRWCTGSSDLAAQHRVVSAAELAGGAPVREAIRRDLIAWALA